MGTKGLSSALLQMKFMQRTKTRLEERTKKKEVEKLQESFLNKNVENRSSEISEAAADSFVKFENRYDLLEDLAFGRMSFMGFNPEVEKLMKYHKDLKDGRVPGDVELDDEQDVTDRQLAASSFGAKIKWVEKERSGMNKMKAFENKILIDEDNEQVGRRKRQCRERRIESGIKKKQYR